MSVNLELYRIFYVVAKHKHMTKASEELHISQPAISQAIKKLEDQLGGILFIRSNKGMELTKEGKMLFEYIQSSLELIKTAENKFTHFKDLSQGEIKIGISASLTKIILLDALKKFHEDHPNITINITNELTKNLILDLQKGKLDFVIFNESNIKESNVALKELTKLKPIFIYNPKYYDYSNKIFKLEELNNIPLILQNKDSNSRQYLDNFMVKNNVLLKPYLEVVSQDLILEFVNIGLGVGYTIKELVIKNYPNLKELKLEKSIPDITVYIATNKSIVLPFASNEFLKYLKRR
ncbi:MAG: LysR family transcriptional regulator [Mollicutes bacterium]|nr:LysR family transcriptional regulator [Mollicutes bacterium]